MKRGRSAGGEPCVWAYRTQGPERGARERSPHRRRPWRVRRQGLERMPASVPLSSRTAWETVTVLRASTLVQMGA